MALKDLPGFFWDEEKKRYFPESVKKRAKPEIQIPEHQQHFSFRRQSSVKIKIQMLPMVRIPFEGLVAVSKGFIFNVADNFTVRKYTFEHEEFILNSEKRLDRQVHSINCSGDLLVVVYLPTDLDSSCVDISTFDFDFNQLEMLEALNFPFPWPVFKDNESQFIFINPSGKLHAHRQEHKLKAQPRALFYHPSLGTVVASTNGHIEIFKEAFSVNRFKLSSSSAKHIFYHSALNSLLLITFHDQLVRLDLESKEQSVLIDQVHETLNQFSTDENFFYFFKEKTICFTNILNDSDSFTIEAPCHMEQVFIDASAIFFASK